MRDERTDTRILAAAGILFALLEIHKQIWLYHVCFGDQYNVWYVPFQLCSMPIWLCLISALLSKPSPSRAGSRLRGAMLTFLQDYGMLGGVMALLVHEGFTFPGHPLLTAQGYVWHAGMIGLSILIFCRELSDRGGRGFAGAVLVLLVCAGIAVLINIALRPYGDCDMFYLSPYHLSSQPVFHEIDAAAGRPAGMVIYLAAMTAGAGLIHGCYDRIRRGREEERTDG